MGILVFTVAILPALGVGSFQIFKAESPGPTADRIVPKIKDTAIILYSIYIGITLIQIFLLKLGGMGVYDSVIHTFGTVGTGGFSNKAMSIGAFNSSYINIVISMFMILSGINFPCTTLLKEMEETLKMKIKNLPVHYCYKCNFTTLNLGGHGSIGKPLNMHYQVSSIITTTGYATVDYDQWSALARLFYSIDVCRSLCSTEAV